MDESVTTSVNDADLAELIFDDEDDDEPWDVVAVNADPQPSTSTGNPLRKQDTVISHYEKKHPKKTNQDVDSVLSASNLVVHRHANQDVVGGSRVEDHVTNCAIKSVSKRRKEKKAESDTSSQDPAWKVDEVLPTQQLLQESDSDDEEGVDFQPLTNITDRGKAKCTRQDPFLDSSHTRNGTIPQS